MPLTSGDLLVRANDLAKKFKSYFISDILIHSVDDFSPKVLSSPIDLTSDDAAEYNLPIPVDRF